MSKPQPAIEIFRPGRHTAMNGKTIDFSDDMLKATADAYDPALHEAPAVVGHPKTDAPAYAWTSALAYGGDRLTATLDQIEPAFAEMVRGGRFKKISASFYPPDAPSNPKPGVYYLKHVGFLGAAPPAVKGLKPAAFAAAEEQIEFVETFDFADNAMDWPWVLRSIARLFRGWRDSLIADKGVEAANATVSDWDIQSIEDAAARAETLQQPSYAQRENTVTTQPAATTAQELADRETKLKAAEDKLKTDATAFAERQKTARATEDAALIDQLVKAGKVAPAIKPELLAFMARLDAGETVAFAEGADAPKLTERDWFRALLGKSGKIVEFGEHSKSDGDPETVPSDSVEFAEMLAAKADDYIAEQAKRGRTVSAATAIRHVQKEMEGK